MSFTCLACHAKYDCPNKEIEEIPYGMSYGRCEDCGKTAGCVDCHGYRLKPKKKKVVPKKKTAKPKKKRRLHPNDCDHKHQVNHGRGDWYCPDCETYR